MLLVIGIHSFQSSCIRIYHHRIWAKVTATTKTFLASRGSVRAFVFLKKLIDHVELCPKCRRMFLSFPIMVPGEGGVEMCFSFMSPLFCSQAYGRAKPWACLCCGSQNKSWATGADYKHMKSKLCGSIFFFKKNCWSCKEIILWYSYWLFCLPGASLFLDLGMMTEPATHFSWGFSFLKLIFLLIQERQFCAIWVNKSLCREGQQKGGAPTCSFKVRLKSGCCFSLSLKKRLKTDLINSVSDRTNKSHRDSEETSFDNGGHHCICFML